jgi:hypothetical protein
MSCSSIPECRLWGCKGEAIGRAYSVFSAGTSGAGLACAAAAGAFAGFAAGCSGDSIARRIMNITYSPKAKAIVRHINERNNPSTVAAWPVATSQPTAPKDARITTQLNKKQNARSDISTQDSMRSPARGQVAAIQTAEFRHCGSTRPPPEYRRAPALRSASRRPHHPPTAPSPARHPKAL